MKFFGLGKSKDIALSEKQTGLSGVDPYRNGFWATVIDTFTGAWQQNFEIDEAKVLSHHTVFSCITLAANDVGKMRPKLMAKKGKIWSEVYETLVSSLLRRPNHFQNWIQFAENYICSKLSTGNVYILKRRNAQGKVVALYILDPGRVTPLVSTDGEVFYQLGDDNLSNLKEMVVAPATEIIHDRMNCLFHPLVGLSPIYAAGLAATQGLAMQKNSTRLFNNQSRPSGILIAPGPISASTATELKTNWDKNYSGENYGKTAVLGDGLKYERISITAEEAQLIEQMKWTDQTICSTFHIPGFKVGVGPVPTYQDVSMLNQIYYSDCLQSLIEQMEASLIEGIEINEESNYGKDGELKIELDIRALIKMDRSAHIKLLSDAVKGSLMKINEGREELNLEDVDGGNSIWMQQQNYSLEALQERDRNSPFEKPEPALPPPEPEPDSEDEEDEDEQEETTERALLLLNMKTPESLANGF